MKNTIGNLRSSLAAAVTVGLFLNAASAFATDVVLSGSVTAITTVDVGTINPLGANLGTAGLSDFVVTTTTEKNNVTAGYTVTVSSANAAAAADGSKNVSKLICAANPATPITYTMKYGGTAVALDAATGAWSVDRASVVNTPGGVTEDLAITTSAATSALAGTYVDTVTLSVVAD